MDFSTYLLWHSIAHIDAYGPKSSHARTRDDVVKSGDGLEKPMDGESLHGPVQPGQTIARPEGHHDQNELANNVV